MKILRKLVILAITALLLAQLVYVARGQDEQKRTKKRLPTKPPADNSDITLPLFSLEIKAEKAIARIGEKLEVEVTMTNTDSQDIFYASPQQDFALNVEAETGRKVVRIAGTGLMDGSAFAARLHPGESVRRYVRLDKEFQLDKPGNYFVRATQGISETNKRESNVITIAIIP